MITRISLSAIGASILLSGSVVFSQNPEKPKKTFSASISKRDTTIKADVLSDRSDFTPSEGLTYHWFASNKILETKGGYDGRLLHGSYTSFYGNKNLRQKGKFSRGLKQGKWINWYSDGRINEVSHWRNGMKNGKFVLYNMEGKVMLITNFLNDKLHGKMISYENGKKLSETRYRNGNEVTSREPGSKKSGEVKLPKEPKKNKLSFKERMKKMFSPKEKGPVEKPIKEKRQRAV